MYSRTRSAVCTGIEGRDVFVETDITRGLPGIGMSGLASTMVMESRERIKNAIMNSGYEFPMGRITVNLTPASLRKNSSCLDLPIAAGILASEGYIRTRMLDKWGMIGELALDGRVLGVEAALPMMIHMNSAGIKGIIVPEDNREEASLAGGNIYAVASLRECAELLALDPDEAARRAGDGAIISRVTAEETAAVTGTFSGEAEDGDTDFSDISGQENAKRAVMIAAAGRHGLLMIGSPGCGKSMIAARMPGVMPLMSGHEMLETAIVRSVAGRGEDSLRLRYRRPFRAPHHTIGRAGLAGGGSYPVPGEITLAHNGVLFLDEICEFSRDAIESLRTPLEEKKITHFRRGEAYTFPCNFQVVMAANPCPCGFLGDPDRECTCSQADIERYRKKLSGPIVDRIDMRITMEKVGFTDLTGRAKGLSTAEMREQVETALKARSERGQTCFNSEISDRDLDRLCALGADEKAFMKRAYEAFRMSPRAYNRTLKVARTIADLGGSSEIRTEHLAEALGYRLQEQP